MRMRCKASGHRIGDLELDGTDAQVTPYPTLLFPRVQAVNGDIRAKTMLGDLGRLRDGGG
jgi:hypothetical protein